MCQIYANGEFNWIFDFPSLFSSLKKRVFKCVFKVDFLIPDLALTTNPLMKFISTQPLIYIFEPDKQNYPELVVNLSLREFFRAKSDSH